MKKAAQVAFCCTIFLGVWAGIGGAETILLPPRDGGGAGILIDIADSYRLLQEVEMCRTEIPRLREKNGILTHLNDKNEQLDEIRREREALLRERIAFLEQQQGELLRLNEAAIRQSDMARKATPWYMEMIQAGKYIGLGVLLGFAIGAAR